MKSYDLTLEEQDETVGITCRSGRPVDGSWTRFLKWATHRKRFTKKEAEVKSGSRFSLATIERSLKVCAESRGFLVERFEDNTFRVRRAVHFVNGDKEEGQTDVKDLMKELSDLALAAQRKDDGSSSAEWSRKERTEFLTKILNITLPLSKGH